MTVLVILLIGIFSAEAQQENTTSLEKHLVKGNLFLTPSLSYELGLSDTFSLLAELGTAVTVFDIQNRDSFNVGVYPNLQGQLRYYTNLGRRERKGKTISGNSGNYLAGMLQRIGGDSFINDYDYSGGDTYMAAVYGLQRTYSSGFSWGFETGLIYDVAKVLPSFSDGLFPHLNFRVGWVIFKR